MPTVVSTFNQGLKVALEVDRGSAPSGNRIGHAWWEGGRWFDVITEGMPTIQDRVALIFPAGHAGDRRVNQQAPVAGREWSDGDFSAPVVADYLGALLYATLGTASTNMVVGGGSLINNEPITATPKSIVLVTQPTDGGNILRFDLKGGINTGTISISGIDAYGNGASESISFASGGTYYARTSWSSIGASGISISGPSTGTVTVFGIHHWTHTFNSASSAPTLAFERIGNPTAGEASANKSFVHQGMVIKELTLDNDAEADAGIFKLSAAFEGDPTGSSTATSINAPSLLKIWPSWTLQIKRDNGTAWNVVTKFSQKMMTGNRNYKAAANKQNPQGSFFGAQEFTGDITVLVSNEIEFGKWRGGSEIQLYAVWTTPWKLGSSFMTLAASLPAYFESPSVQDSQDAFVFSGPYRIVRDDNFPMQYALTNGVPGVAYQGTSI